MKQFILLIIFFFFNYLLIYSQHILTIKCNLINAISNNNLYLASNSNDWNPKNENYKFTKLSNTQFQIKVNKCPKDIEFKITQGNWQTVECTINNGDIPNRKLIVNNDTTVNITIYAFKNDKTFQPKSTASDQVKTIADSFYIPQLKTKRKIVIYLPKLYDGIKQFPVLYMHDGQNLFDAATSAFNEWGIDEYLDSTKKNCIVVGIYNSPTKRLNEYNPYDNIKYGKGEGKQYATFIATTLKKYIDTKYKTLSNKENTFIAGSSMGALISYYISLQYPSIYGKVGVFSPSFWINMKELKLNISKVKSLQNQGYFFYAGTNESATMVNETVDIYNATKAICNNCNLKLSIKAEEQHNEISWKKELPEFFNWLTNTNK